MEAEEKVEIVEGHGETAGDDDAASNDVAVDTNGIDEEGGRLCCSIWRASQACGSLLLFSVIEV